MFVSVFFGGGMYIRFGFIILSQSFFCNFIILFPLLMSDDRISLNMLSISIFYTVIVVHLYFMEYTVQ